MDAQKKRFVVFSLIVLFGFLGAYQFLNKKSVAVEPQSVSPTIKKDSVFTASILLESFDIEANSDPSTSTEKAFSGKKSVKLSPEVEYGFGVNHVLRDFPSYQKLTSVSVSFKCFSQVVDSSAVFVFAINDKNGKQISWNGGVINCAKKEDWSDVTIVFEIKPEFLNPDNTLVFYPWNKQKKTIFIDDISLNFIGSSTVSIGPAAQVSNTNFFFDFETTAGLTGAETIKETTAHSGKFACDLTGGKEYGPSVIKKIKDIASDPIKKISLSMWVYPLTDNSNTVLTSSIVNSKNENVFWDGKSSENKNFTKNKWTKINAAFNLPTEKIAPDDVLTVNIWNKGKTDVLVDDLEIVYGEMPDRKGFSSTIDVNSIYEKRFVPIRNKPPFKTIYFQKQEINNGNGTSIIPEKNTITSDFSPNDTFIVGNFVSDKNNLDEIICLKSNKSSLSFEGMYSYSPIKKQFEKIWENTNVSDSIWNDSNFIYSGDFNKDGKSDILLVNKKDQGWIQLNFDGKKWIVLSSGKGPKKEWLTRTSVPNSKDVFKSSDIVFYGSFLNENKQELLTLNTDWRFDLKLIEQDKEGYNILGNVDFQGYQNDYNPKYYEFTKIVSGKFISTTQSSLLIMMRNCADENFKEAHCNQFENLSSLPNSTALYSFTIDKK
jgi:hypothetical protein